MQPELVKIGPRLVVMKEEASISSNSIQQRNLDSDTSCLNQFDSYFAQDRPYTSEMDELLTDCDDLTGLLFQW